MKSRPVKNFIAILTLVLLFLTGPAGVRAYVWCLDEDGHAALETAAGKICDAGSQDLDKSCHEGVLFDLSAGSGDCGPCLDLPATLDAASRRSQDHLTDCTVPAALPAATTNVSPSPLVRILTVNLHPLPPPGINQTLLFQRTVVLRS